MTTRSYCQKSMKMAMTMAMAMANGNGNGNICQCANRASNAVQINPKSTLNLSQVKSSLKLVPRPHHKGRVPPICYFFHYAKYYRRSADFFLIFFGQSVYANWAKRLYYNTCRCDIFIVFTICRNQQVSFQIRSRYPKN